MRLADVRARRTFARVCVCASVSAESEIARGMSSEDPLDKARAAFRTEVFPVLSRFVHGALPEARRASIQAVLDEIISYSTQLASALHASESESLAENNGAQEVDKRPTQDRGDVAATPSEADGASFHRQDMTSLRRTLAVLDALARRMGVLSFHELWTIVRQAGLEPRSQPALVSLLSRLSAIGSVERPYRGAYKITDMGIKHMAELRRQIGR